MNAQCTLSEPTTQISVRRTDIWVEPVSAHGICYTRDHKALQHLENQYCHEYQSIFSPFLLDQTMTTHILNTLQWHCVLTDSSWTHFDQWVMLYHRPESSSTPGKTVVP